MPKPSASVKAPAPRASWEARSREDVGGVCDSCGESARAGIDLFKRSPSGRSTLVALFCSRCLSVMLEIGTGYSVLSQLDRWDRMKDEASAMGVESGKSKRALRKAQEKEAARRRRKGQTLNG